jgi:general secretion pathway protein E
VAPDPRKDICLADEKIDPAAFRLVSARVANHYRLMPLGFEGDRLRVAMSSLPDVVRRDELRMVLRREIFPVLAGEEDIAKAIKEHYGLGAETVERLNATEGVKKAEPRVRLNDLDEAQDASVIRVVNQILMEAYENRATDIHLEPYEEELRVRYRIDGVLYDAKIAESLKRFQAALTSRIKIMADLSIAEKRLPQDGRIKVRVGGQEMDLRVSTLPTPYGESVGIRLLTSRQFLDLRHLGFEEEHVSLVESYLEKPHGILFLTGPTGSGKTTTLYAFLNRINGPSRKIITIEDPIEYQMKGVTQVQVQPAIGLTFAQGLRSMLRHDPDVMMVGEVRDLETAEIAIRVALTGHLVFSTLHTNDAAGAVARLEDIGVEPYLISSSINCVIAQRLVRVICPSCREETPAPPDLLKEFGVEGVTPTLFRGRGCPLCKSTGFQGRTVIYEILPIDDDIREMVASRQPSHLIRERAMGQGMRTLRQSGWNKIIQGITTPDEVLRATLQEGR